MFVQLVAACSRSVAWRMRGANSHERTLHALEARRPTRPRGEGSGHYCPPALVAPRVFCVKALAAHTPSRRRCPRGTYSLAAQRVRTGEALRPRCCCSDGPARFLCKGPRGAHALAAHTPSRRTRPRGADALAAHTPQQRSGPLDSSDSTGGGSGEGSDDGSNSGSRSSSIVALEFMRLPASN